MSKAARAREPPSESAYQPASEGLGARRGPRREKGQHSLPVVRRAKAQAEEILILWLHNLLPHKPPNLGGRPMVDLADGGVKSPYAAETRSQCDLIHWESRLINNLFCKMQTPSLSDGTWRRTQMPQEQPTKMTRTNSQPLCQAFNSPVIE